MTKAFDLEGQGVKAVIHAVGPVWKGGRYAEDDLLQGAYRAALRLADQAGMASVGLPAVSTGVYGFPVDRAANLAMEVAIEALSTANALRRVVFVLYDVRSYEAFDEALDAAIGGA